MKAVFLRERQRQRQYVHADACADDPYEAVWKRYAVLRSQLYDGSVCSHPCLSCALR